jgi:hypothetical protein
MLNLGEYRKYVENEDKLENGNYKIKFANGTEKNFESKGIIKAIKTFIDENIINKVEVKEADEEIEAKEVKEENTTSLSLINAEDMEILKQIIAEYKLKSKTTGTGTSEAKTFDYSNIQIPTSVRKMKLETFSIRANQKLYDKLKEIAKTNSISISTLINYLFFTFLNNINVINEDDLEE